MKSKSAFLVKLAICIIIIPFANINSYSQTFSKNPSWKYVFSSLWRKPLKGWNQTFRNAPSGKAFFTDSIGNVFIKNGALHIKATDDKKNDKICSSGYVSTLGYKTFKYGKLELKAKIPTGKGIFPAIWLLQDVSDPVLQYGEIDMMEYIECFEGKEFATTIHLNYRNDTKSKCKVYTHTTQCKTDIEKYHIYGLEWTPDSLTFTLDRKPYYTLNRSESEFWPFDEPYILILDVEYGSWGASCGMDDSIFPKEMLIDWIRYYPLSE